MPEPAPHAGEVPGPDGDDALVATLSRTFAKHAQDAPAATSLGTRVREARRRQVRRHSGMTAGVVLAVSAAVGLPFLLSDGGTAATVDGLLPAVQVEEPDDGWRWESYRGLEVQVPDSWMYGTTGAPWCLRDSAAPPYVGRPGVVESIGCTGDLAPLDQRGPYLWFGMAPGAPVVDEGWTLEGIHVGSEGFTLFTDDPALRDRIVDSARLAEDTDANGCPVMHPLAKQPELRPSDTGGFSDRTAVTGITACQYTLGMAGTIEDGASLTASERLDPATVQSLVPAILAAPPGVGPDEPDNCLPEVAYGDSVMVLRVITPDGTQEVYVRSSGCAGHGTDDGTTQRELTAAVAQLVLQDQFMPAWFDASVAQVLGPS